MGINVLPALRVILWFRPVVARSSAGPVVWQRQNRVASGLEERHRPVRAPGDTDRL